MIIRVVRFVLLVGALTLAGCNGDAAEPSTLPDIASSSPAATPDPTATETLAVEPPVEPDNAHDYSPEGVEAFTLYAIDVINYAYQTNDVTHLEQIGTDDCEFCDRTVDQLTVIGQAGGRIEGGQLVPDADLRSISGPVEGVQTSAGIELTVTASKIINGQGDVTHTEPDRERYYIFNLAREGDSWKLQEVSRAEGSSS